MGKKRETTAPRWQPTALSRLIERRIHELDMRQADLAKRLHVDQSYVSNLVAGRLPDMDAPGFIENYSRALEIDTETFISEGELWRYNIVPPGPKDLTPGDRAILASLSHLDEKTKRRIADGMRAMYGEETREPPLEPAPEE